MTLGYPNTARIRSRTEILSVSSRAKKLYSRHFLILVSRGAQPESRLAVTISKKVDKRAVARNRLRRRVRELFRQNRSRLRENFDIHVIARKNSANLEFSEVRREFLGALYHAKLISN